MKNGFFANIDVLDGHWYFQYGMGTKMQKNIRL